MTGSRNAAAQSPKVLVELEEAWRTASSG